MHFCLPLSDVVRKSRITALMFLLVVPAAQLSAEGDYHNHSMMHKPHHQKDSVDLRTSLNLPPKMAQHQLSNMRRHLEAVQEIVSLLAEGKFENASETAWQQLGSRPAMMQMCNRMGNEDFKQRGLNFHKSGDALAETLKTKDFKRSLSALNNTLQHCTSCHATYKQ